MQEIERVADEFELTLNTGAADIENSADDLSISLEDGDDFQLSDSAIMDDDEDSLVIDMGAATVDPSNADDEELMLAGDDDSEELQLSDGSEIQLAGDQESIAIAASGEGTADLLADENELSFGSSDIKLASDSEAGAGDDSGPATNELLQDIDDDGDLLMSEDDLFEDELKIEESHEDSLELSSDFESSDDVIIESDSSAESDILEVSDDSDFSLSDSGLVELADDSAEDMIVLDEPAALEDATALGDDDFNLTPVEEAMDLDDGSQVIALEDADMYDDASATILSPSDEMEAAPMLTDDAMSVDDFSAFPAGDMAVGAVPGTVGALPESPYSGWQIASLGLVLSILTVGGAVAYDLARNLWLPQDQIITGGLLPTILGLFGG